MHPVRSYPGRPAVHFYVMATSLPVLLGTGFKIPSPGILLICAIGIFFLNVSPKCISLFLCSSNKSVSKPKFSKASPLPLSLTFASSHPSLREISRAEVAADGKVSRGGEDERCTLQGGVVQNCFIAAWNVTTLIKINFGMQHHRKKTSKFQFAQIGLKSIIHRKMDHVL